ncbi:MAG: hypothetical protein ACRC68_19215, partial [Clostridium sp.]
MDKIKKVKNNNMKSFLGWGIFFVVFGILIYFYNVNLKFNIPEDTPYGIAYEKGEVTKIIKENIEKDPDFSHINIGTQELEIKIISGIDKGEIVIAKNFIGRVDNKPAKVGTKYVISSFD